MFWKRFYFVAILLSCNCFLLCCNGFCEFVKKFFGCGQTETTNDSDNGQADNKDNKNIYINNILLNANNVYKWGDADFNDSVILYNEFKNIDFSKLELIFDGEVDLSNKCRIDLITLFCSATDHAVGKSSIFIVVKNHTKNIGKVARTIGVDFFSFHSKITDNTLMKVQVWDTASDSKFKQITNAYYKNKNVIVFVYDITNDESFKSLEGYIKKVKTEADKGCLFFLLGNKLDLIEQNQDPKPRKVTIEDAKKFAADNDLIFLGECSAKENRYMPVAENTCYKQGSLQGGNCPDGVTGIFKDILSNIVKKQKIQGE